MRELTKKYKDKLEFDSMCFTHSIEATATMAFVEVILPWLKKNNYHMLVGNGTYYIFYMKNGRDVMVDPNFKDDMPEYIREVLQLEVEHHGNPDLGCWMPDYNPEDT